MKRYENCSWQVSANPGHSRGKNMYILEGKVASGLNVTISSRIYNYALKIAWIGRICKSKL
jgi:hypothetical protein